jgi:hypothetical protein
MFTLRNEGIAAKPTRQIDGATNQGIAYNVAIFTGRLL